MDFPQEVHETIEQYINNRLKGDSLRQFEAYVKKEPDLKKEIKFQREMKRFLSKTQENALRESLESLSDDVTDDPNDPAGFTNWRFLMIALPLFLLAGWWFMNSNNEQPKITQAPSIAADPTETNSPEAETIQSIEADPVDPPKSLEKETTSEIVPPAVEKTPPPTKKERPKKKTDVANSITTDPYATNPIIENLMKKNTMIGKVNFKVDSIMTGTDEIIYHFKASIDSEGKDLSGEAFKLLVYTNNKVQFKNSKPIATETLTLESSDGMIYKTDVQNRMKLKPGLYYYIFRNPQNETFYSAGSFSVYKNY